MPAVLERKGTGAQAVRRENQGHGRKPPVQKRHAGTRPDCLEDSAQDATCTRGRGTRGNSAAGTDRTRTPLVRPSRRTDPGAIR